MKQQADRAGNLQLAFDVAARDLDIPKMLDVGDMLDVPRPDERYFQCRNFLFVTHIL